MHQKQIRVLYSFPHKIGAGRICTTAWHQVDGAAAAGVKIILYTGSICRPFGPGISVRTTLQRGRWRIPYRLIGTRLACILHDFAVSRKLEALRTEIDVIHLWPLAARRTLRVAKRLGIPTVLERPNAHTRYAYDVVRDECRKLGIKMPQGHEHDYNAKLLAHEESEYDQTDFLLCPSDFVAKTFSDRGFPKTKLLRHQYGFDANVYRPDASARNPGPGITAIFVGGCAPRKGLHYALAAWLASTAHQRGKFLIAGAFIPGYAELLAKELSHPSIEMLGHRNDVAELMRKCDVLTLPSIEEGSALVTSEARGSGCVLLVSDAAGAICQHGVDSFVHQVGDVAALTRHFNQLDADRSLLESMRARSLATVKELTWAAAGVSLAAAYGVAIRLKSAPNALVSV